VLQEQEATPTQEKCQLLLRLLLLLLHQIRRYCHLCRPSGVGWCWQNGRWRILKQLGTPFWSFTAHLEAAIVVPVAKPRLRWMLVKASAICCTGQPQDLSSLLEKCPIYKRRFAVPIVVTYSFYVCASLISIKKIKGHRSNRTSMSRHRNYLTSPAVQPTAP